MASFLFSPLQTHQYPELVERDFLSGRQLLMDGSCRRKNLKYYRVRSVFSYRLEFLLWELLYIMDLFVTEAVIPILIILPKRWRKRRQRFCSRSNSFQSVCSSRE